MGSGGLQRCIIEIGGLAVGVVQLAGDTYVFSAVHPKTWSLDGAQFDTISDAVCTADEVVRNPS